jgi:hypothetical protein
LRDVLEGKLFDEEEILFFRRKSGMDLWVKKEGRDLLCSK